jgi:alpha-L-rhamnosidase
MNWSKCFLALGAVFLSGVCSAAIATKDLRCEYLSDPLSIGSVQPRLSWILTSSSQGEKQTAYQIEVGSSAKMLAGDAGDLWDSGKVLSDESTQIEYNGKTLVSREQCFWKVRAWNRDGQPGPWSPVAQWQMGLLEPIDWRARWISTDLAAESNAKLIIHSATYEGGAGGGAVDVTAMVASHIEQNRLRIVVNNENMGLDPASNMVKHLSVKYEYADKTNVAEIAENQSLVLPEGIEAVPYLRKSFRTETPVQKAILYVSAMGLYEVHINGKRVGDHALAPDWTDYRKRVQYQAYDVTKLLKKGNNAIAALLASGWFSGHIGNGGFEYFGKNPEFLAQLEVTYINGRIDTIVTDDSWKWHSGPIRSSDFMLGESYDARLEIKNWDRYGLDESQWDGVVVRDQPSIEMDSQISEPVRELCELKPKSVSEPTAGHWVYDLGQNMVGIVRLKVSAPSGTKVTLRHAEMLNSDGTIYTNNLRGAPSLDEYICKGDGVELWQPRFTFHGFRYVEISGLANSPGKGAVTGIVIGSDARPAGEFSCSDPRINQLQSNIQWGQRGNYLSIPTDCPQRDERLGWMGDAEVFVRTATYNADVAAFFTKWMLDVDDGQSPEGTYGDVSPNTMGGKGTPGWADAGVICPWTIYEAYGDKRILERHLPAMTKWVEFMKAHSNDLIRDGDRGSDYGDWLSINADTPKDLIGTAFFAYSTHLLAKSYNAVGREAEAEKYEHLFEDIKTAFDERYVSTNGRIKGDTQCAYAMALKFDLLSDDMRFKAAQYLNEDIKAKNWHLSTGFIGVGYLLPVLTQTGNAETAYRLLFQDTYPSWLFPVKQGATTIWERWDGWTPEKGFQDPEMNSFNHYSLGSCGEYLFGGIGGIQPETPGFKKIHIEPIIRDGLTWANASFDSIHGKIVTAWKRSGDRITLDVVIPANTTATVCIPTNDAESITEAGKELEKFKGIQKVSCDRETTDVEIESGTYQFGWNTQMATK